MRFSPLLAPLYVMSLHCRTLWASLHVPAKEGKHSIGLGYVCRLRGGGYEVVVTRDDTSFIPDLGSRSQPYLHRVRDQVIASDI